MNSPRITVREARPEEGPRLLELICALADYEKLDPPDPAAQQRLLNDIFGPKPRLGALLVFAGDLAVGYALILETYSSFLALPTLYLEDIFVLSDYRGVHAGSTLFRAVVAEAKKRGCGRVDWVVLDWNRLAQDFYVRYGARHLNDWQCWRLNQQDMDRVLGVN